MQAILADLVWPALFLGGRLLSWWAIGMGLLVELFFVRWLTGFSWPKSLVADITMNGASSLLGWALIPLAGSLGDLPRHPALQAPRHWNL
jgi:hypothetical protein